MRIFEIFEILKPTLNWNFSDEKFPKFSIKIPFFYRFFPFFRLFFSFYNDPGKGERRDLMHDFKFDKNSRMLLKGFKSCNMGLGVKLVL